MPQQNLVLSLPQATAIATSLGIDGFAWHRSPGSGRHYQARKVFFDLRLHEGSPAFEFLDEGGWRDLAGDTRAALEAVRAGKRTKTAISNGAFACTPVGAAERAFLVKTAGDVLELARGGGVARFAGHEGSEELTPDQVARAAGQPAPSARRPRTYLVISPIQLVLLSNLTPAEYAWYATHRPGKIFRQVCFAELRNQKPPVAADSVFEEARRELEDNPVKKTKTIASQDCMNRVLFSDWKGYDDPRDGGLYIADREHVLSWRFPAAIPREWERAEG